MSRINNHYMYIPVGDPVPRDLFVLGRITIPKTRKWVRYDMQQDLIDVTSSLSPGMYREHIPGPIDITIEVKDRGQDEWRRASLAELGFTKTPRNLIHALSLYGQDLPGEYYECQYIPLGDEHTVESLSEFIERSRKQEEELRRTKRDLEELRDKVNSLVVELYHDEDDDEDRNAYDDYEHLDDDYPECE
jgi:hypothetical protein